MVAQRQHEEGRHPDGTPAPPRPVSKMAARLYADTVRAEARARSSDRCNVMECNCVHVCVCPLVTTLSWRCEFCEASYDNYEDCLAHEKECAAAAPATDNAVASRGKGAGASGNHSSENAKESKSGAPTEKDDSGLRDTRKAPAGAASPPKGRDLQQQSRDRGGSASLLVPDEAEPPVEWQCDVCKKETFDSYEDCVAHEKACAARYAEKGTIARRSGEQSAMQSNKRKLPTRNVEDMVWQCDVCGRARFETYGECAAHERECDNGCDDTAWQCDVCGVATFETHEECAAHEAKCTPFTSKSHTASEENGGGQKRSVPAVARCEVAPPSKRQKVSVLEDGAAGSEAVQEDEIEVSVFPGRLGLNVEVTEASGAEIVKMDPDCVYQNILAVGDRIVSINGKNVKKVDDLIADDPTKVRTFRIVVKSKASRGTNRRPEALPRPAGPSEILLPVPPGRLGLDVEVTEGLGASITKIDPACIYRNILEVGDRIAAIDGKEVKRIEDLIPNDPDKVRKFRVVKKRMAEAEATEVNLHPKASIEEAEEKPHRPPLLHSPNSVLPRREMAANHHQLHEQKLWQQYQRLCAVTAAHDSMVLKRGRHAGPAAERSRTRPSSRALRSTADLVERQDELEGERKSSFVRCNYRGCQLIVQKGRRCECQRHLPIQQKDDALESTKTEPAFATCNYQGCNNLYTTGNDRMVCYDHYYLILDRSQSSALCNIKGCKNSARKSGLLCSIHYSQMGFKEYPRKSQDPSTG